MTVLPRCFGSLLPNPLNARSLTLPVTLVLLVALSALPALAGTPPVPIEGKLFVCAHSYPDYSPCSYYLEGSSDNALPVTFLDSSADISPLENRFTYMVWSGAWGWPFDFTIDIWTADLDGANAVRLTGPEGSGSAGINCEPFWSPDGTQIVFTHCDPIPGQYPCDVGFETWVMDADGTDAHRVTPEGMSAFADCWAPNGYRLLGGAAEHQAFSIDLDGTDLEILPTVQFQQDMDWSPDGSKLAWDSMDADSVGGEPGVWRRLVITNPDGSEPEVLFEHFIKDSDVAQHLTALGLDPADPFEIECLLSWVGPRKVQWSPAGDRVAFNVAYPFDPSGLPYGHQIEVWVYDLTTADLTRITDNTDEESFLSWKGDNTSPSDPEVTVDNTTVTFSEVTSEGLTTIIRDDDPPEMPTGYKFAEEFYAISTTANTSGSTSICMTYRDEDIPSGVAEEDLAILHYVEVGGYWEDITVSRDAESNIVCGESDSLSAFVLSAAPPGHFPDVPSTGLGAGRTESHWAFGEIEACVAAGVVSGYPDG